MTVPQETAGNARVFYGEAAVAYKAGFADGEALERARIAAAVTDIRDNARRLTQAMPPEIAIGLNAQDEALTAVLDLIGES